MVGREVEGIRFIRRSERVVGPRKKIANERFGAVAPCSTRWLANVGRAATVERATTR